MWGNIVMARRFAALGLLLVLSSSSCARSDWIESTLVTADVAGQWQGTTSGRYQESRIEFQLKQSGARISGTFRIGRSTGELEGNLNGDVFRFSQIGGDLAGELTVGIDEMAGWLAKTNVWGGRLTATLKRQ